ncbi:MAG TPA: CotH kinase family protein [Nevskiaceae bacterium]|nr:CotH kinase family protein [Nevskiaceae bacterium]
MNVFVDTNSGQHRIRGGALIALLAGSALALSACGPNGNPYQGTYGPNPPASGSTASPPPQSTVTSPASPVSVVGLTSSGDLQGDPGVYSSTGYTALSTDPKSIDDLYVAVLEPATPGPCNDGSQSDVNAGYGRGPVKSDGKPDYSGCTLTDVNNDHDHVSNSLASSLGGPSPGLAEGLSARHSNYKPKVDVMFCTPADGIACGTEANGTIAIRGGSSRLARLKSYKIKLDKPLKWRGQSTIQLNKEPDDLARVLQKLSFDLFRDVPDFVSLRTSFVHLHVDDLPAGSTAISTNVSDRAYADYGLFTQLEDVDDHWADAHGLDSDSNIIKSESFAFLPVGNNADCSAYPKPDPLAFPVPPGVDAPPYPCLDYPVGSIPFEEAVKSEGSNEDMTAFMDMISAVNDNFNFILVNYPDSFAPVMTKYFHADNFATWLAMEVLLQNADSVNNNFYLYRPTSIDNFYFTPWDYDKGYDWLHQAGISFDEDPTERGVSHWWQSPLVRRFLMMNNGAGATQLTAKVKALYGNQLSPAKVRQVLNSYPLCPNQDLSDDGKPLCPMAPSSTANNQYIGPMLMREPDIEDMHASPNTRNLPLPISAATVAIVQSQWETYVKRIPATIAAGYNDYMTNIQRPMPMFVGANPAVDANGNPIKNEVQLSWDPSYSVQGRALSYDVVLSQSAVLSKNDPNCKELPAPTFNDSIATMGAQQLSSPIKGPETFTDPDPIHHADSNQWTWDVSSLAAGTYYFQVIARDSAGNCQISFDVINPDVNTPVYGVFEFKYDPSAAPDRQITVLSTDE